MNDPIALLRAFVRRGPYWYCDDDTYRYYIAQCCDYAVSVDESEDHVALMEDECNHDETCPWRLAKEYLENIG